MVKWLNKKKRYQAKYERLFIALVLCVLLTACSNRDTPEGVFNNYLYRLHNSLEIDEKKTSIDYSVNLAVASLPRYPKRPALLYALSEPKINLLDFLRLSQCELQRHIGERNSSLGKLQQDSQRFIYEVEFIRLAKICIASLKKDNPLRDVLQTVTDEKRQQLPLLLWNATFASKEFAYLFSLSTDYIGSGKPVLKPVNFYESLKSLERMMIENQFSQSKLESALAVMASRKVLGEIRRSMIFLIEALAKADHLLDQRINRKPLCRHQQPNRQFEIVNTVFRKFYIGEVQPYIASVYQQAETSLRLMDNLVQAQQKTESFTKFWSSVYLAEDSEWQNMKAAIKNHTKRWQALLQQCGSLPQA